MLRVEVPGRPVPKARPRFNSAGGIWTPSSKAEEAVAWYFVRYKDLFPSGPVKVRAEFFCNPRQRADADNLLKLVCDAITRAGVWRDDFQAADKIASRYTVPEGEERTVVFLGRPMDFRERPDAN